MASALLIDHETFREEKAKQAICSVPVAIRDDCLYEQMFHWDYMRSGAEERAVGRLKIQVSHSTPTSLQQHLVC